MGQLGLTCANGVADGKKSLAEKKNPSPLAMVVGFRIVRSEADAQTASRRLASHKTFCASAQGGAVSWPGPV